jgi:sodium transport system permease protein
VIGAEHAPNLVAWLGTRDVRVVAAPDDADGAVRRQEHDVVLRIDARFAEDWRAGRPAGLELVFDSSRPLQSGATVARLRSLLSAYDRQVGTLRLVARGIHPAVAQPLQVGERDVATPGTRFDLAQQMLPYLLLLLAFVGGMQLAIDATAGERERQSLEPLLATPASREAIIGGKILATAAFAMLSVLVTLLMYRAAFAVLPADRLDTSLAVPIDALARLLLVVLPVVLLGATVLTALAAFARSHREAQGYLPLLIFLPMLPTLYLMVAPVKTQAWMLAVPFLGQNQLILRILRGEPVTAAGVGDQPRRGLRAGGTGVVARRAPLSPRAAGGERVGRLTPPAPPCRSSRRPAAAAAPPGRARTAARRRRAAAAARGARARQKRRAAARCAPTARSG